MEEEERHIIMAFEKKNYQIPLHHIFAVCDWHHPYHEACKEENTHTHPTHTDMEKNKNRTTKKNHCA